MLSSWKKEGNQSALKEIINKDKKHASPDFLFKADGDYALLAFTEISSLKYFLTDFLELDLKSNNIKNLLLDKIKIDVCLKFALESYLVNSCQMLLDLNESTRNNGKNDNIRKSLQNSLDNETKIFMSKLSVTRKDLAHHYTSNNQITDQYLTNSIFTLLNVADKFLQPLMNELNKNLDNTTSDVQLKIINNKAFLNLPIKFIINEQTDSTKIIMKSLSDNSHNASNINITEKEESKKRERELTEEEIKEESERSKKIRQDLTEPKAEDTNLLKEVFKDDTINEYRPKK